MTFVKMTSVNISLDVPDADPKQKLLRAVKKEVKQIMEEAVTRKFIHEESSGIISLCVAVEACLKHCLKKRVLGLFKHGDTSAILQKASKNCEAAAQVVKVMADEEHVADGSKRSLDSNKNQTKKLSPIKNLKYLWIRHAIFEKQLAKILEYLVQNSSKYYEAEALIADPVEGRIFSSLLVGPCALDYTKMKTSDHYWTDPPADELVKRHRIHSSHTGSITGPGSPKRPGLQRVMLYRRNTSSSSEESAKGLHLSAKDYVESLHQNSKTQLLYGKNNVLVQPKEDVEALAGYLSLHQTFDSLIIKWTPNQLMNGCCDNQEQDRRRFLHPPNVVYWDYALTIYVAEIVYIHCHQQPDCGGTIVLVGQDGVQRPPIHFPKGGHLLAFLSCLETGLLPHGQLDPPLWSQRGKGKVFPKLKKFGSVQMSPNHDERLSGSSTEDEEATDYVFRIIQTFNPENIPIEMLDPKALSKDETIVWHPKLNKPHLHSVVHSYAKSQEERNTLVLRSASGHRCTLKQLCDMMKTQIISRAFYGWLAHCRHLKTVRTHLLGLVHHNSLSTQEEKYRGGLTEEIWESLIIDDRVTSEKEIYNLIYFGGVQHEIRRDVWPYLLGHYKFGYCEEEREAIDEAMQTAYEQTMSEWLAVEAIVRQRDKEVMAANMAKLSSESDCQSPFTRKDSSLSNDVFISQSCDSDDAPETVPEESSTAMTTPTPECTVMTVDTMTQTDAVPLPDTPTTPHSIDSLKSPLDSPDDGLGSSISRTISHTDRSKLSSAGDSVSTDDIPSGEVVVQRGTVPDKSPLTLGPMEPQFVYINGDHNRDEANIDADDEQDDDSVCDDKTSHNLDNLQQRVSTSKESLLSPSSPGSNGGIYSTELLENVGLNLHRIDKDVQRCDRNYWYFSVENLEKLRNIMCTYVWEHLDIGYVQGMCDLAAPLLVIFDDEVKAYSCFCELMKRMTVNFPHGGAMDTHFANMRSLIQILDSELFEHMHRNGDYTHFYFCYRWFLLDFKRELLYEDVFSVWETIWVARHTTSAHFGLFFALALVESYRDIILDNKMDFTDIIKFFNEMAEQHNARQVLTIARELVTRLQNLIENK